MYLDLMFSHSSEKNRGRYKRNRDLIYESMTYFMFFIETFRFILELAFLTFL